jgi:hypothetical protein
MLRISENIIPSVATIPLTPTPPATSNAPVVFDVDAVVLIIFAEIVVNIPAPDRDAI